MPRQTTVCLTHQGQNPQDAARRRIRVLLHHPRFRHADRRNVPPHGSTRTPHHTHGVSHRHHQHNNCCAPQPLARHPVPQQPCRRHCLLLPPLLPQLVQRSPALTCKGRARIPEVELVAVMRNALRAPGKPMGSGTRVPTGQACIAEVKTCRQEQRALRAGK